MTDYTPSTEELREAWDYHFSILFDASDGTPEETFDRWLQQVKAEAWDEGYGDDDTCTEPRDNPYRPSA